MRLIIVYDTSDRLKFNNQEDFNLEYLKNRFNYFFSDYELVFLKIEEGIEWTAGLSGDDLIVHLSLFNVMQDEIVLRKMIHFAQKYDNKISVDGAVPGTQPKYVVKKDNLFSPTKIILDNTQREYNTQLNLYRLKRVKIFNSFIKKYTDFYKWPLHKILEFCSSKEGVEFVLSYGENVPLSYYDACPLCNSSEILNLHSDNGHPVTGFLTKKAVYYQYCQDCELVFSNPHLKEQYLSIYYDEHNFETPFKTKSIEHQLNNITQENVSHLSNYEAVLKYIKNLPHAALCLDIGGGNGEFCQFSKLNRPDLYVELFDFRIDTNLQAALTKRDIHSKQCDITKEDLGQHRYDLITNWEVIEHMDLLQIKNYFTRVYKALKKGGLYIFSTPDFKDVFAKALDFWAMAPGEHLSVFSRATLQPLLTAIGFEVVEELHESVTIKSADRWFKYGSEAHANFAARAESEIINYFLQDVTTLEKHKTYFRDKKMGSELILILKK